MKGILLYVVCCLPVALFGCHSGRLSHHVIDTQTTHFTLFSEYVKDSFDIYISLPDDYTAGNDSYPTIYYMDANLKMGNAYRRLLLCYRQQQTPLNAISIGIGHFRNYPKMRARDLVTPNIDVYNDSLYANKAYFGHSEQFYQFLKCELIPYVERTYRCNNERSWIGHSLGGLFAFYCMFKKEQLFTNYVALSAALWVHHKNIYEFEKRYHSCTDTLEANVYMCAGSKEKLNRILHGSREMKEYLEKRNYADLHFFYEELEGKAHNTEVPQALSMLVPELAKKQLIISHAK